MTTILQEVFIIMFLNKRDLPGIAGGVAFAANSTAISGL
jgi:hypothetical protein